jgi:20S proteasome subunit alpha 5
MTLVEAHTLALRILKQVMEEKLDQHNVQLAQVRSLFIQYYNSL